METRTIVIDCEYHPSKEGGSPYHLLGFKRGYGTMPRQRWFDSHGEMLAAVEAANPGVSVTA